MKNFDISSDSTADIYFEEGEQLGVFIAPLRFIMDFNGELEDSKDNFKDYSQYLEFYNKLRNKGISKTSMLNYADHMEHFTNLAKNGVKELVHFSLSGGLSPTFESAIKAANDVREEYPDFNAYIVESSSATVGQRILVKMAVEMRDRGCSAKETAEKLESVKNKVQHFFMVDDLGFLKRGGRVSGAAAVIGSAISLKPILSFNKAGKLVVVKKEIGRKKAIKFMLDQYEKFTHPENDYLTIIHTGNEAYANELANGIKAKYNLDAEIRIMGPTIGSHVGPDAVGYVFMSNEERPEE